MQSRLLHLRTGAVVLVVLSYLIPLLVGLGVTTKKSDWELGYFAAVAQNVSEVCLLHRRYLEDHSLMHIPVCRLYAVSSQQCLTVSSLLTHRLAASGLHGGWWRLQRSRRSVSLR